MYMPSSWLSIVPPLLVLLIATVTHYINASLFIGIVSASLIARQGSIYGSFFLIVERFTEHFQDINTRYLYLFLTCIGIIISLIQVTQGATAFAKTVTTKIKHKITVETSTIGLAFLCAIDDYLSILTNGHVMHIITDRVGIPRLKLAYLVHALSSPLVILIPVSSWIAAITVYIEQAGISNTPSIGTKIIADPFFIYLESIPFIFYSLILIGSVLFIVFGHISYGQIHRHEILESLRFHSQENLEKFPPTQGGPIDLILPIASLLLFIFIGLPYMGDYWLLGGTRSFKEALLNNQYTFKVMCCATLFTIIISVLSGLMRKSIAVHQFPTVLLNGLKLTIDQIIMIVLAACLGTMLNLDILTGTYLATLLHAYLHSQFLPITFFILSLISAVCTGSSWGTYAVLFPIAVPMITSSLAITLPTSPDAIRILIPVIGAIFSGGICGEHISPVSGPTIMTAISTGTTTKDHTISQLPYLIPVILGSMVSFVLSGYLSHQRHGINAAISLSAGMLLCLTILYICNEIRKRQRIAH